MASVVHAEQPPVGHQDDALHGVVARAHALGIEVGAVGQERAADGQQLVARQRATGQQGLTEVRGGVDLAIADWRCSRLVGR